METTMEFDDMKAAWQTLDRRLEQQHALNLQLFRDSRADKARSRLRPLFWGQMAQILFGGLMILLGVSVWNSHRDVTHLLISGIIVHVYGVVAIVLAGVTLGMIQRFFCRHGWRDRLVRRSWGRRVARYLGFPSLGAAQWARTPTQTDG